MRIRRGDTVQVIAGEDASPTPRRILQVVSGGRQVLVEGVNKVFKHVRRGHPKSPRGGRLAREMPIDSSNVMLYCEACHRGVRVGYRYEADGAKARFCKSCSGSMGAVSPAKARYAKQ